MKARRPDPSPAGRKVAIMQKTSTAANDHANDPTAPRPSGPLVFNKTTIRDRDQFLSLTDMWKAAGGDKAKQPANWLASTQARDLIEYVGDNLNPRISGIDLVTTNRGGNDAGTWAHWHIAFAYAKYLSPAFHVWCNEVVRAVMEGRMVPIGPGLAKTAPPVGLTAEQVLDLVGKVVAPLVEAQRQTAQAISQIQAQVTALHRDHNAARDMAAIGGKSAADRIKKPIVRIAKEKARYLGGKKAEASFNRKFHIRVREACEGFQGPWDRLPRGLLGSAETCIANIEREVRADTMLAEREGYRPVQMNIEDTRVRRPN